MKRFYIPTTSLNFNNILSSESISPKAFYRKRGFGYSRWETIPENPLNNSVVLYADRKYFNRPISDVEDHPMLIEIAIPDEIAAQFNDVGDVYLYDRTIYIDPFSTRFIFFSEKDRRITLSMSEASLETKMRQLYEKRFVVDTGLKETYIPTIVQEVQQLNEKAIAEDRKINRMKGLLYGYYIGAYLSSDMDSVKHLKTLRDIQDIFSAILSSLDRKPTPKQYGTLVELFKSIEKRNAWYKELSAYLEPEKHADDVLSILAKNNLLPSYTYKLELLINELVRSNNQQEEKNSSVTWIEEQISSQLAGMRSRQSRLSIEKDEIVVCGQEVRKIENAHLAATENVLLIRLVNDVLSSDKFDKNISPVKVELARAIAINAKEQMGVNWDSSEERRKFNAVLKHANGDTFDLPWGDDIYSSLAIVITKGDDWHSMLRLMQDKLMTKYAVAFAVYGALRGFANMPRDFVDEILNDINTGGKADIANLYKEIYGQLFSRDIQKLEQFDSSVEVKAASVDKETEEAVSEDMPDFEGFDLFFKEISKGCKGAGSDVETYRSLYYKHGLTEQLVDAIEKDSTLNKGKGAQKGVISAVKKLLKKNNDSRKHPKNPEIDFGLNLPFSTSGQFLEDFDYLCSHEEFVACVSRHKDWKKDLFWFISEHRPNAQTTCYKGKPLDNDTVIRQFIWLKKGKYQAAEKVLRTLYNC